MPHTAECRSLQRLALRAIADYVTRWPAHCQKCNGWGSFPIPDSGDRQPSDPCLFCADMGLCPRCLFPISEADGGFRDAAEMSSVAIPGDLRCSSCGWTDSGNADMEGCPLEYGVCGCHDAEDEDYRSRWTLYCRGCNGWGFTTSSTELDGGISVRPAKPCRNCLLAGKCPRCAQNLIPSLCRHCQWLIGERGRPEAEKGKGVRILAMFLHLAHEGLLTAKGES